MSSIRWLTCCLPALVGVCTLWGSSAQGQFFHDDFEDGSATDGSPVAWMPEVPPWPVGQQRVEGGTLILTPAREAFPGPNWYETDWEVDQDMPADIVVRTSVRTLGGSGDAYHIIYARDTTSVDAREGIYTAFVLATSGYMELAVGKNLENTTLMDVTARDLFSRAFDVNLELRLAGDEIQAFAWREGTPRPAAPTLWTRSPPEYVTPGRVGVGFAHRVEAATFSGAFRFVEVAAIPEPSTLALLGLSAAGGMRRNSRRRLPFLR